MKGTPTVVLALGALGAGIGVVNALPRSPAFSGDAIIHLAVAERAAAGDLFEFNPGQAAGASSSLAWTLLEALLLRTLGLGPTLVAVKVICLAAWVSTAWLAGILARRDGAPRWAGTAAAGAVLAIAGVSYNALLGMENIVFAALTLATVARWDKAGPAAVLCGLCALLTSMRFEGMLVVGALIARSGARKELGGVHVAAGTFALATLAAVVALHWAHTGAPFPASATARAMDARRAVGTLEIAGVHVYGGVVLRLLAYAGLTYLALEGARAGRHGAAAVALVGVLFYTFVVGSSQVARQASWIFACLAALAGSGAARLLESGAGHRCAVAVVALLGTAVAETATRFAIPSQQRGGVVLWDVREAAAHRRAQTDALLERACAGGCCTDGPVSVALIEVQLRFSLDERVRVVSLDGRTAPAQPSPEHMTYDAHGCPDVDALLERAGVVAVLDPPRFEAPCAACSLASRWGEPRIGGFRFDPVLQGYVRACDAAP